MDVRPHTFSGRLDTEGAANHLGVSASLLNKQRCVGRGPRFLQVGSRIFYRVEDLDAYLNSCVVETVDSRRVRA